MRKLNHGFSVKLLFTLISLSGVLPLIPLAGESRIVRVGVSPAAPLIILSGEKPAGLFIDLIEYFARKRNWQIEYVKDTWGNLQVSLDKGDIDLLPAIGYTAERAAQYDLSEHPVYIDSGVLFTSRQFIIHTVFDLQGKRVAALKASIFTTGFVEYISSFGVQCDIILTNNNEEVMQAIADGDVDAGVCIYSLGNVLARRFPVTITPISFSPVALVFGVAKGRNADLLAGINELMSAMINNPESVYSQSFKKWTAPPEKVRLPTWLWWGIAGLLALGLIMLLWNSLLKRQVSLKTRYLEAEISERWQAEKRILQTLNEKETLIRELYHRTKNTMQVMRGMITLQAAEFPGNTELQKLVRDTDDRIQAISLVHQMLYKSNDLSRISIKEYTRELTTLICRSFRITDNRITLNLDIADQFFLLDTAIPLGLILNELLTNSLKHAFPGSREGVICINLTEIEPGKDRLQYSDNGIGVSDNFDFRNQSTLGLKLIINIGELQMMGILDFKNDNGIVFSLEFPTTLYEARI